MSQIKTLVIDKLSCKIKNISLRLSFVGVLASFSLIGNAADMLKLPEVFYQEKDVNVVRNAILDASAKYRWEYIRETLGAIDLKYQRGKSFAVVIRVFYSPRSYFITYVDSFGLDYARTYQGATIHRNYNKWIRNLNKEISTSLGIAG